MIDSQAKGLATVLCLTVAFPTVARAATVTLDHGDVLYSDGQAAPIRLTGDGGNKEVVLSPDGASVAFIKIIAAARDGGSSERAALWQCTIASRRCRPLLQPAGASEPKDNLLGLSSPIYSLKGNFLYVMADAWTTSGAVHQVDTRTGAQKFVADANSIRLIENGRYAGDLLVSQHRYHAAPESGSYEPASIIDPDGKVLLQVSLDDDETSVTDWTEKNHVTLRAPPKD